MDEGFSLLCVIHSHVLIFWEGSLRSNGNAIPDQHTFSRDNALTLWLLLLNWWAHIRSSWSSESAS